MKICLVILKILYCICSVFHFNVQQSRKAWIYSKMEVSSKNPFTWKLCNIRSSGEAENHLVSFLWMWKFKGHTGPEVQRFSPSLNLYKISTLTLYSTVSLFFLPYPIPRWSKSSKTNKSRQHRSLQKSTLKHLFLDPTLSLLPYFQKLNKLSCSVYSRERLSYIGRRTLSSVQL